MSQLFAIPVVRANEENSSYSCNTTYSLMRRVIAAKISLLSSHSAILNAISVNEFIKNKRIYILIGCLLPHFVLSFFFFYRASGPDKICGNVLRSCCYELAGIFTTLFNLSLRQSNIPTAWKTAEIIPVPKKPMFTDMNNLRPVALTPIVMKYFERSVLKLLKREVEPQLDPLQFAYKTKRGVEDTVLVFVNNALKHMESLKTFVCILFIDFSSAFNTIQPHILVEKLLSHSLDFRFSNQQNKVCQTKLDHL